MKKEIGAILLSSLFMTYQGFAQTSNQKSRPPEAAVPSGATALPVGNVEKYLVTWDYNSWFEKLTVTSPLGTQQESQAQYYGFGFGLEKNFYQAKWGWGFGGGLLNGSAVGGDKAGALTYFQARVPWWAARVSPRWFYRLNSRTDFGVDLAALYKQSNWPAGLNKVKSGAELITGAFVDLRVRFNPKLEMVQSFGMVYPDETIYWRLGLAYRL